jgi:hypothetical protein
VALSDPRSRLRGRDGEFLPQRRPCLRCSTLISAWAPASDRLCIRCAPLVDDEPPRDPALYCPHGHLRAEFEVVVPRRSRRGGQGVQRKCKECKRLGDAARERSAAAVKARQLERDRERDRSRAAQEERRRRGAPKHAENGRAALNGSRAGERVPTVDEWLVSSGFAELKQGKLVATPVGLAAGAAIDHSLTEPAA